MWHLQPYIPRLDLRIGKGLFHVVNRRRRDPNLLKDGEPLIRGSLPDFPIDILDKQCTIFQSLGVIHETLVDLLMIQQKIHPGIFAVMDGTFTGDGPGPRCMTPYLKNIILASSDQVAIDAVAAYLMGFDPLKDIRFIRLAHERGLGCGDIREIDIVGDQNQLENRWNFMGPYTKMTFASKMQHLIYWGPLKKPLEWSLKTFLAPWSYIASVLCHDFFWYPTHLKMVNEVLKSAWGRLFNNWEKIALPPDDLTTRGFKDTGEVAYQLDRQRLPSLRKSMKILGTCIREAPEFSRKKG